MPWKIVERAGQHCVVKETTGETLKCYPERSKALAYLRALYANEPGASKPAPGRPSSRRT